MSTPTPPGEPAGSTGSNRESSTPGPSHQKAPGASRSKAKGPRRDERDFSNANSMKGIIQGIENQQSLNYDRLQGDINALADRANAHDRRFDELSGQLSSLQDTLQAWMANSVSQGNRPRTSFESLPSESPIDDHPNPPPVPRVEMHQTPFLQPRVPRITPETSPSPSNYAAQKSKLTEKIEPLSDGIDPTFRQWRISIRDRFTVNADHYASEVTKKALIWSTTTGLARSYLEPRYQADDEQDFRSAQEMINTLESYFTTGYETEEYRNQFHDMFMCDKDHSNETFPEFSARFRSMAVLGKVSREDWFYQMWDKITPSLRTATASAKHLWHHDFHQMVFALTSTDLERRRNYDRPSATSQKTPSGRTKLGASGSGSTSKTAPKPYRPYTSSGTTSAPRTYAAPPKFSTTPIPPPPAKTPAAKDACYVCGETGHYKAQCPKLPTIRALIREIDETPENNGNDDEDDAGSDGVREGNEEA